MSTSPLISVMVPVYNTESYVEETVRAILNQTFKDFELIIIDDGSKDRSPEILRKLASEDSRIRLTLRENRGIVATRNEMLAQARGEFVVVNDSDDISLPTRLEKQLNFLREHPELVCVGSYFKLIDESGRFLRELRPPTTNDEIQKKALGGDSPLCHSSAMIRKSAMDAVNGYTPELKLAHDLDLWLKLGEIGPLANYPEGLVKFRLHEKSVSETKRYEQRDFARQACEAAWKRRGIEGKFTASEPWRPGKDADSQFEYALQYGWWAFRSGQRRTAFHYGKRAITRKPFKLDGWRLATCALVKPIPPDR